MNEGSGSIDEFENDLSIHSPANPIDYIAVDEDLLANTLDDSEGESYSHIPEHLRQYILEYHNNKRSSLASGLEPNLIGNMQSGKNIYQLEWDNELERIAATHISACSSAFINGSTLKSSAQVIKTFWLLWDGTDDQLHVKKALEQWWNQGQHSGNEDARNRYFNRRNYIGWANMAKGKTTRIGCSYKQCSSEQKAVFICIYSEKAQCELEMIYEPGEPCTSNEDCFTYPNSKYNGENTICSDSSNMTDAIRDLALSQHNFYRSRLARGLEYNGETNMSQPTAKRMIKMEYNCELERYAQKHAEKCVFAHSNSWERPNQGQNLYMTSTIHFDPRILLRTGIEKWWQELEQFGVPEDNLLSSDMWRNKGKLVGHWTQMAWDRSYHLGCAVVQCPLMGYVVCHYGPAGNRRDQIIYETGDACATDADCQGLHCISEEGLCAHHI
ncbi:unnamed protein product [Auanema sp. JU1783]|nr:unnamed protein product [Auanema sp. JU1783]